MYKKKSARFQSCFPKKSKILWNSCQAILVHSTLLAKYFKSTTTNPKSVIHGWICLGSENFLGPLIFYILIIDILTVNILMYTLCVSSY